MALTGHWMSLSVLSEVEKPHNSRCHLESQVGVGVVVGVGGVGSHSANMRVYELVALSLLVPCVFSQTSEIHVHISAS